MGGHGWIRRKKGTDRWKSRMIRKKGSRKIMLGYQVGLEDVEREREGEREGREEVR